MLQSAIHFRSQVEAISSNRLPQITCLNRDIIGAENEHDIAQMGHPKLIITSPPYPGIHILYHRWQVGGRKETPAPFWIASELDGAGLSHYTLGNRRQPGLRNYFNNLEASFRSIARIAGPETTVVQLVAFSDVSWQLPRYLEVMENCGLREQIPWSIDTADGRLWRDVPNRRWHTRYNPRSPGAREVVLIHRL